MPAASCQRVTVSDTPANQRTVTSVLVDDKEVVWLGTLHGIRRARRERGDLAPARPSDPSWSGAAGSMGGAVDAAPASATLSSAGAGMVQVGGLDRVLSRELSRVFRDSRGDTWFAFAGSGLARLVVSPFLQLLYSTQADDVAAIARLRRQGLGLVEAIELLVQHRSGGREAA